MSRKALSLTPEQTGIIGWTASLGAITAEALALRLDITVASARARLGFAQRHGLLARERPLVGRPALFTATPYGLRRIGVRGIDRCRIAPQGAQHLMACASAAAALERCYPDHRLVGERELRRDERDSGGPLASATLSPRRDCQLRLHRPDLVLWPNETALGSPVAVEVELTVKAPRRLVEICGAWNHCRSVGGVLYLVSPGVERALVRAVAQARASERIAVMRLDALPGMEIVSGWLSQAR